MTTSTSGDDGGQRQLLTAPHPWLSQGDIFPSVPIIVTNVEAGEVGIRVLQGPAMLVTHDCALDKPVGRSSIPRAETLHFVTLKSTLLVDEHRRRLLRESATQLDPSEVLYLGEVGQFGESYVDLSQVYGLPAALLPLELHAAQADEPEMRLTLRHGDDRLGSLSPDAVDLLRRKWIKYWTRRVTP